MSKPGKTNFYRNADKLTVKPVRGEVTGTIPTWLEGVLIRNGPGVQKFGPDEYNHLFDGMAVLHRFEIKNGEVFYQNQVLDCDAYRKNKENERIILSEFGTIGVGDPCKTLFDRFKTTFFPLTYQEKSDNCNVNVAYYGDQLYAMTERTFVRRVDPKTLAVVGPKTNLRDHITVNHATAHPHILEDGTVLNMGNNFQHNKGPHYCIISVPPSYDSDETSFKDAKILAEIPARWKMYPSYYHSFGMTTDKIVFVEQPYLINVKKVMLGGITSTPNLGCFAWHHGYKTRIHVIPRKTGRPETLIYETDNLFTFHHINAYEDGENIILDLIAYDNAEFVNHITADKDMGSDMLEGASARRYVLPLSVVGAKPGENLVDLKNCHAEAYLRAGEPNVVDVKPHYFAREFFEFPRINYKYNGKNYNYFYGCEATKERRQGSTAPEPNIITKCDITTGKLHRWQGDGIMASEPVFVPNPTIENPDEDDGVIISPLLHQDNLKLVTLLVLDAKTMKELGKVKFSTEGPVAATFHGIWASAGEQVHTY